ncbi:class I SAM-dependent methyltransferase [Crossiella sp. CA-258035]|uniref:class I SAM-dependent methyltransferase n=1 Tax=Crossiella sp. CA-258035 TaxID=2981138 RepID=UPI0024BD4AA0|nr:class I SAM-dependent methyltransferase [Crossiella sp. CA-258035]WHT20868.1 class I SAM-dependent methyltransferase [Crossiella sp. CA-258035]
MATSFPRIVDSAFGHPRGLAGRIGGAIMVRAGAATERELVAEAGLRPTDTVLVLGPGPGVGLAEAARVAAAGRVIGVDPAEEMLRQCRQRCAEQASTGHVRLHRGDAEDTGQPEASVDVLLTVNTVHLWRDRTRALAELYRVLRPGGRLIMSTHRMLLDGRPATLRLDVECAGFARVLLRLNDRRGLLGPSYELTACRPENR